MMVSNQDLPKENFDNPFFVYKDDDLPTHWVVRGSWHLCESGLKRNMAANYQMDYT